MITIRRSKERGHADLGWLDTRHTFSFGDYHDPRFMGFGNLRVINEDHVKPGRGFGTHGHRDMEIITYVLEGSLAHKDSMGNGSTIEPLRVQRMTAGTGVLHSELNPSTTESVHLLQIWILPERNGLDPSYEEKSFSQEQLSNQWKLIASRGGREESITVHQDVDILATKLDSRSKLVRPITPGRHAWIQVARGGITLNGQTLEQGDGAAIDGDGTLDMTANKESEVLLFDMARGSSTR